MMINAPRFKYPSPIAGPAIAAILLLTGAAGCTPQLRQTLTTDQRRQFRAEAVQFLKDAVYSSDPILTMNAIEAFQETGLDEGVSYIADNVNSPHAAVAFAAMMALGTLQRQEFIETYRTLAESADPNVQIAAIFAMHRCGDPSRTGDLGTLLLNHASARVRANAALALGRLEQPSTIKLLQLAQRRERKTLVVRNILEALCMLGDKEATERLIFLGFSAVPSDAVEALMMLANARSEEAEDLFLNRLSWGDHPELKLQAARGLGRIGVSNAYAMDLALAHLFFNSPRKGEPNDPPEQQIDRVRALAALAVEALGREDATGALHEAFTAQGQHTYVKLAIARAAIHIIDHASPGPTPARPRTVAAAPSRN